HITIEDSRLHLQSTPPVRLQRPSVDVLFASMAGALGEKSVGIILSGSGKDGSEGLRLLKKAGGITMVQDPLEAAFPSMPNHGINTGCVDFIVPVEAIAQHIAELCSKVKQVHA